MTDKRDVDVFMLLEPNDEAVVVDIDMPGNLQHAQQSLFNAFLAGYVAAGMTPGRISIEVLPTGAIRATASGAYCGLSEDPHLASHRTTISAVVEAALLSFGFIRGGS